MRDWSGSVRRSSAPRAVEALHPRDRGAAAARPGPARDRPSFAHVADTLRRLRGHRRRDARASAVDIALWDLFGQASVSRSISAWAACRGPGSASTTPAPATDTCAPRRRTADRELGPHPASARAAPTRTWTPFSTGPTSSRTPCSSRASRHEDLAVRLRRRGVGGPPISSSELDNARSRFARSATRSATRSTSWRVALALEPPAAERGLRALEPVRPFWVEDPIKMTRRRSARARASHPRADLRQRDGRDPAGVPRIAAGGCGGRGDARSHLVGGLVEARRSPRWPRPGVGRSRRTTAPARWC